MTSSIIWTNAVLQVSTGWMQYYTITSVTLEEIATKLYMLFCSRFSAESAKSEP